MKAEIPRSKQRNIETGGVYVKNQQGNVFWVTDLQYGEFHFFGKSNGSPEQGNKSAKCLLMTSYGHAHIAPKTFQFSLECTVLATSEMLLGVLFKEMWK